MTARFGAQGVPALVVENERGGRLVPSGALFADADALTTQLRAA